MDKQYKMGDKHPTKDRVFWSYSHKEVDKRKELWLTPDVYTRKRIKDKEYKNTEAFKEYSRKQYLKKKEYISQRDKNRKLDYKINNPFALMISCLKPGAKRRGLPFQITKEILQKQWEKQDGKCYYTGLSMEFTYNNSSPKQMSVDKKDPKIGYTEDNIVLCCQSINFAKHDFSEEEFMKFLNELENVTK